MEVTDSQFNGNGALAQVGCEGDISCFYGGFLFPVFLPEANGLWAFGGLGGGEIVLDQVQTLNNYGHGTVLFGDEIIVLDSTFNGNGNIGAENLVEICDESIECYEFFIGALGEDVFLWADGMFASHLDFSSVTVECSQANDNSTVGFEIYTGDITLNGVTATGNGELDFYLNSETDTINIFDMPCSEGGGGGGTPPPGLPLNIVPVTGGEEVGLDCDFYIGTLLKLENGDHAILPCPIQDVGILTPQGADGLPGELGDDFEFASGMTLQVLREGASVDIIADGVATVAFTIPDGVNVEDLAILWWTGSEWVPLSEVSGDGRVAVNPGFVTEDGFFAASVNFTGTFILVQK